MKSARLIGYDYGYNARDMNFFFKFKGLIDGLPGDYFITDVGKQFGKEEYFHRGTGGYSWYNRYWTERTWDEETLKAAGILDNIHEEMKLAREATKTAAVAVTEKMVNVFPECKEVGTSLKAVRVSDHRVIKTLGIVLGAAAIGYGLYCGGKYIYEKIKEKKSKNEDMENKE